MSTAVAKRKSGPTFELSTEELDLLRRNYPWKVQSDVLVSLQVLLALHRAGAGKMRRAWAEFPGKPHGRGWNYKSLCRKLALYLDSDGDWTVLVNRAKLTRATKRKRHVHCIELVPAFVDYWRALCDQYQRRNFIQAAHHRLLDVWYNAVEPVDGYGYWFDHWVQTRKDPVPPVCPDHFLPAGWTYDNLRRFVPSRDERNLTRFGVAAAKRELLRIPQTRVGMLPLEWVTLDDVRTDFLIAVHGCDKAVEMLCVVMKDIPTDVMLRFVSRPALPKEEGGKEGIKRRDVKQLLVEFFMKVGYPLDYVMNLVIERGTASMTEAEAQALEFACGGHVKVHFTEMIGGRAIPAGFVDGAVGNPFGKAWLESAFNLMHNLAAAVPGQTGASWQLRPLELHGRQQEQVAVSRVAGLMDPAQRHKLRAPFLNYQEANLSMEQIFRAMNGRRKHKLEGFDQVSLWRWNSNPPGPWMGMEQWPEPLPPGAEQSIEIKHVNETPLERFSRLAQGVRFQKMAPSAAYVFLDRHQQAVKVDANVLEIGIEGKTYRFRDEDLCAENGARYLAYYSPKGIQQAAEIRNPSAELGKLYLVREDGSFAGTADLWFGVSRRDEERLRDLEAQQHRAFKRLRQRVSERSGRQVESRIADVEANLQLAAESMPAVELAAPDAAQIADGEAAPAVERLAADLRAADAGAARKRNVDVVKDLLKNRP